MGNLRVGQLVAGPHLRFSWRLPRIHEPLQTLRAFKREVTSIAFSPDGTLLAAGSAAGTAAPPTPPGEADDECGLGCAPRGVRLAVRRASRDVSCTIASMSAVCDRTVISVFERCARVWLLFLFFFCFVFFVFELLIILLFRLIFLCLIISLYLILSFLFLLVGNLSSAQSYKIRHCYNGCPQGTSEENHLIIRSIYALSYNTLTKSADWVSYKVSADSIGIASSLSRAAVRDGYVRPL